MTIINLALVAYNWTISALTSNWLVEGWAQALLILAFIAEVFACVRLLLSNTRYIEKARMAEWSLRDAHSEVKALHSELDRLTNALASRDNTIASMRVTDISKTGAVENLKAEVESLRAALLISSERAISERMVADAIREKLKPFERKKGKGGRFVKRGRA